MPERTSHPPGTISWTDLATTRPGGARRSSTPGCSAGSTRTWRPATARSTRWRSCSGRSAAAMSAQRAEHAEQGDPAALEPLRDGRGRRRGRRQGRRGRRPSARRAVRRLRRGPHGGHRGPDRRACFCLWQAGTNIGAEVVNEPGALTWADLATTDAQAAQAFYTALLGWRFEAMSEEPPYWVIFNGERSQGGMTVPPPGVPSNWFPYFVVDRRRRGGARRRRRPAARRSWGRSTCPAAASR